MYGSGEKYRAPAEGSRPYQYDEFPPAYGAPYVATPPPPSGQPHNPYAPPPPSSPPTPRTDNKFAPSSWRDLGFAIVFLLHLAGMFALAALSPAHRQTDSPDVVDTNDDSWPMVLATIVISAGASAVFSFIWLAIVRALPRQIIVITLVLQIMLWLAFAFFLFAVGNFTGGAITLVVAALFGFMWFSWRRRIPFAAALLETVSGLTSRYPATAGVAYLSMIVQVAWVLAVFWMLSRLQNWAGSTGSGLLVLLVFSFYWTSQVIKNTVHVTVSGVIATWYFLSGVGIPPNPTAQSFKRATTTSFGSICFGSLVVAVLQTLRWLVNSIRAQGDNFLAFCASCILGCIEGLVRYFNVYAFTQVAIYGKSFIQAAKDTWELVKTHGIEAIVNDNLISGVLQMGSILGGIVGGVVGGVVGSVLVNPYWLSTAIIGFLIGYTVTMITMEVVQSGVATLFVCFAMDPAILRANNPDLYAYIAGTNQAF